MLGLSLAILFLVQSHLDRPLKDAASQVIVAGLKSFNSASAFFAIAIQLATISVVVQKDFGINTSDFGAIETQIAQAVSVLSMLPLLYPTLLLDGGRESSPRTNPRLFLLCLAAALSFYPFLSRNIQNFRTSISTPAPISDGDDGDVSTADWHQVETLCFDDGLDGLRRNGVYAAVPALELTGSLIVYLATLWQMGALVGVHRWAVHKQPSHMRRKYYQRRGTFIVWRRKVSEWFSENKIFSGLLLLVPLALAIPLLWTVFYMRQLQETLAHSTGEDYNGNKWGFGQMVSLVLFLPVFVDMFYCWKFGYTG